MRNPITPLGGTELEVLREVWALRQATAREVHDRVSARRRVAYTTIMTVMKNLATKGYLSYEQDGAAYVYTAARQPDEVRGSLLTTVMEKVFGGSPAHLIQTLVQSETLTEEERAEIRRLIDRLDDDA
ncbi:MAG: BlaI/MecI/CopY family transcriptional regulator [Bacteroidota bacterium]